MAVEELREKGLVEDFKPNFAVVSALIARSLRDLSTARANASIDREWAYAIAYQGMLRAARAMIIAEGLRPRGRDQQRTVVQLAGARGSLTSPSYLVRKRTLGPPLENNPKTPPASRDEGLRLLHGLETNLTTSLQTPQEG